MTFPKKHNRRIFDISSEKDLTLSKTHYRGNLDIFSFLTGLCFYSCSGITHILIDILFLPRSEHEKETE